MTSVLIDENHDKVVGKALNDVLKSNYKIYESNHSLYNIPLVIKIDLTAVGNMRNHHDILMSYGEDSQEENLNNPDGDRDVPNIMSDTLTKSQVHEENYDHAHEDVEANITIDNDGVFTNHDHELEDVKTLGEGVISKNEIILMVYASNSKEYRVISKNTQFVDDMTPYNDEDLIGFDKEQVVTMIFVEEYESVCDAETFDHLEAIRLIQRPSCIMKLKHGQIDVKSIFLNSY